MKQHTDDKIAKMFSGTQQKKKRKGEKGPQHDDKDFLKRKLLHLVTRGFPKGTPLYKKRGHHERIMASNPHSKNFCTMMQGRFLIKKIAASLTVHLADDD